MKVLYSKIKELVPDLTANPREVAEVLTMIGMMVDGFRELEYMGQKDYLLSLETRNRVDCWSLWGVARELAAYYNLKTKIPNPLETRVAKELHIVVGAREAVRRIRAVEISGLKNQKSPQWLAQFLAIYEMKSLNLLVDLSNYVMIVTGYASHLIDKDKLQGNLTWQINKQQRVINTLDGSELKLNNGELLIVDDENVVALAGLVGTQVASISEESSNVVLEMAVYDSALIKKNSRQLNVVTEAGNRLAKEMDAQSLALAFDYLLDLIINEAGGEVLSQCDYYPAPRVMGVISFDPSSPSRFAGIEIGEAKAMEILLALRCQVVVDAEQWLVTVPSDRGDLTMAEDLIEEVIRMNRYDSIPSDQLPALPVTRDLTRPLYYLKDDLRIILAARGFDEVLSQPLVDQQSNEQANYLPWQAIVTQNSVNEEFPVLRLGLITSLVAQCTNWLKKNIEPVRIFEIGKVFGKEAGKYQESEHLALLMMMPTGAKALVQLQQDLAVVMGQIGLVDLNYQLLKKAPALANHHSAYLISADGEELGVIYKLAEVELGMVYVAELDLEKVVEIVARNKQVAVCELTQKLVVLDANLELASRQKLQEKLVEIKKEIGLDYLWGLVVSDVYKLDKNYRYTVRVSYQGLGDQDAKTLHDKLFN